MTQLELVRGIRKEIGKTISQSYISQIENGSRRQHDAIDSHNAGKIF